MDPYKLYRSDRGSTQPSRIVRLVEVLAAIVFVLIVIYLVR